MEVVAGGSQGVASETKVAQVTADETKMEAHRLWRQRIQANLDVFAGAVENDDVGVGVHAMTDLAFMAEELGHSMLDLMFGRVRVLQMMMQTIRESKGVPLAEMETEDHKRWFRAMVERGGIDDCDNPEHLHSRGNNGG